MTRIRSKHLRPAHDKIHCWYINLPKGGDTGHRSRQRSPSSCREGFTPSRTYTLRLYTKWKKEGLRQTSQSHNPRWNKRNPGRHWEWWPAKWMPQAAKNKWGEGRRRETMMGQAPAQDVPWCTKAGLDDSTEALIIAAKEQALNTRSIEARVYRNTQEPRFRLCKDAPETVQHRTAGYKIKAGRAYLERHNQVIVIIYRNNYIKYGLIHLRRDVSVRSLYVLPVSTWIYSEYSGFLPQSKNM